MIDLEQKISTERSEQKRTMQWPDYFRINGMSDVDEYGKKHRKQIINQN